MLIPFATGFATGFSLILAIGAQNAFVLRQGLTGQHVFWVCLLCAVCDSILIGMGVAGFGYVVQLVPGLPVFMLWGGALFLIFYGATRFMAAWRASGSLVTSGKDQGLRATLLTLLALTLLNPHVYLDTFALIGAVSTGFEGTTLKTAFGLGAMSSSFVFFFSLGYGARLIAPLMTSPRTWVVLDVIIGVTMWVLAVGLILSA